MRKTILMACLAAFIVAACTPKSAQEGWVKVEGNNSLTLRAMKSFSEDSASLTR